MRSFFFSTTCCAIDGDLVRFITDDSRCTQISYRTFTRHVDLSPLRQQKHPAAWRISAPTNWAVSFWRSVFPSGAPVYYFDWSRIEHFFIDRHINYTQEARDVK